MNFQNLIMTGNLLIIAHCILLHLYSIRYVVVNLRRGYCRARDCDFTRDQLPLIFWTLNAFAVLVPCVLTFLVAAIWLASR